MQKAHSNKSVYILGLNEAICASAALLKNGEIVASASEERFTRIKNQWGFPKNAINYCFKFAKINSSDIDLVVLSYKDPYVHFTYGRAREKDEVAPELLIKLRNIAPRIEYHFPFSRPIADLGRRMYYSLYEPKNQKKQVDEIADALNISSQKIVRMDHHLCHAYTTYCSNPNIGNEETLVLTCDGAGDQACAKVYLVKDGIFKCLAETPHTSSLGLLYSYITSYLGLKAHEDEYKVMGLAPYAKGSDFRNIYNIFKNLIWVDGLSFESLLPTRHYGLYLKNKLANLRFDHIAGAIQKFTEDLLISWVKNAIEITGIRTLAFGGGVFLNVKANQKIANLKEVKQAFFMPSASDDTNAIGAAYYGHLINIKNQKLKIKNDTKPLSNLYLGPEYEDKEILEALKKYPALRFEKPKDMEKTIAKLLAQGEIVARFAGRMEMGARALGNRSILADPRNYSVVDKINRMIKMRDFWMPFAPTILSEKQYEYIKNPRKLVSPFMAIAFDTTSKGQKDLVGAIHPYDKTTRPQILKEEDNPTYYNIIKEFEKLTGVGAILNTSFNVHGEPIVNAPHDALSTLKRSGLKYLAMGNYLIKKP